MTSYFFRCAIFFAFVACSSQDQTKAPEADAAEISCDNDSRAMTYAPNLTVLGQSKKFQVELVAGVPAPPARNANTWTIRVLDASGMAAQNATVTALPFMPDHGHGSPEDAAVTANADGTFTVAPLDFFMPGLWRVTLSIASPTGTDSVVLAFCVAG